MREMYAAESSKGRTRMMPTSLFVTKELRVGRGGLASDQTNVKTHGSTFSILVQTESSCTSLRLSHSSKH